MGRADVQDVEPEPVELGAELGQAVQPLLGRPPVVALAPVAAELAQIRQRDTLGPVGDRLGLRPARTGEAIAQVTQVRLGNLDVEWDQGALSSKTMGSA